MKLKNNPMRDLKDALSKMRLVVKSTNQVWSFVVIFEVIVVIAIGVLSNQVATISLSISFLLLIIFSAFYILVKVFFLFFNRQISSSPIEEIEARYQLDILDRSYARINIINETISSSLYILNDRTCTINNDHQEDKVEINKEKVCNREIHEGFERLLSPLIKNVNFILECSNNSKISIGIYIEQILSFNQEYSKLEFKEGIFLLKDDIGLAEQLPISLNSDETNFKLTFQNALKESFNNNKYYKSDLDFNNQKYSILASIIPCVCSDDIPYGVLFIITDCIEQCPNDLESILAIFNRINSNWNAKYRECFFSKYIGNE